MEIQLQTTDEIRVAALKTERLDARNAQEFQNDFMSALAGANQVVLDISGVHFVDSSGLGAILTCRKKLKESGGDLKLLCDKNRPVRMFFELARMYHVMDILGTKEEAILAFRKPPKAIMPSGLNH